MNADWVLNLLMITTGATTGWYVARQQNEIGRLRKRNAEMMALIAEQQEANDALMTVCQQLAEELARERSDDWWKGETDGLEQESKP